MKIAVIGTGYVGLTTGTCFAHMGHDVTCVDIDADKIKQLNQGNIPIFEPELSDVVKTCVAENRLHFTTDMAVAMADAVAVFIAVGTPPDEQGNADLQYVFQAVTDCMAHASDYGVIVTKSTVPVGTGAKITAHLATLNNAPKWDVVSNPEFLREGSAVQDFLNPDRIVVGAETERAFAVMAELYMPLTSQNFPLHRTNRPSAEMIKYASNAFLATKISFVNQVADLCEKTGADIMNVAHGMGLDSRIGDKFLHPGPGYGGSCFPKDTMALIQTAQEYGTDVPIVTGVVEYNKHRMESMTKKITHALAQYTGGIQGKTIAILGVAFKGNTDDMRDSPALNIIPALQQQGITVRAYDPQAMDNAKPLLPNVAWATDVNTCVSGADAMVIMTEWEQFATLNMACMAEALNTPLCIDLRNLYTPEQVQNTGMVYVSVGRGDGGV